MISNVLQQSVNLIPWSIRSWIKHIPVVAKLQRWFFAQFLSGKEFIHLINAGPARGLKYPVSLPKDKSIWAGTYETDFALSLASAVKPGEVCYDIGGYRGFFSGVFALAGARLVVTFEPLPENCEQLYKLAEINPHLPLRTEAIAVGDCDETVEFRVMPEASMGKISDSTFQPDVKGTKLLTVPIRKLDSLVFDDVLPAPQIIKIDVEGAEVHVLKGATKVLSIHRPRLFIEAHSQSLASSCTSILNNLNYKVTVLETGVAHDPEKTPDICHLVAQPYSSADTPN